MIFWLQHVLQLKSSPPGKIYPKWSLLPVACIFVAACFSKIHLDQSWPLLGVAHTCCSNEVTAKEPQQAARQAFKCVAMPPSIVLSMVSRRLLWEWQCVRYLAWLCYTVAAKTIKLCCCFTGSLGFHDFHVLWCWASFKVEEISLSVCICILTAACKELRAWSGGVSVAIEEPIANPNPIVMARLNSERQGICRIWTKAWKEGPVKKIQTV